mgnify:CR=1 FL=1
MSHVPNVATEWSRCMIRLDATITLAVVGAKGGAELCQIGLVCGSANDFLRQLGVDVVVHDFRASLGLVWCRREERSTNCLRQQSVPVGTPAANSRCTVTGYLQLFAPHYLYSCVLCSLASCGCVADLYKGMDWCRCALVVNEVPYCSSRCARVVHQAAVVKHRFTATTFRLFAALLALLGCMLQGFMG